MALRAEASERLSDEIIANLTAGLLMVNQVGRRADRQPGRAAAARPRRRPARDGHIAQLLAHARAAGRDHRASASAPAVPIIRRAVEICRRPAAGDCTSASPSRRSRDDVAAPHGVICLFTDLSAVVALEEQVRLKDSLARVGELTAGIAHEFRNGLATIHGYSRLLDLDALPPAFRPYVEGHPRRNRGDARGRDQLPELRAPDAADAVARRSARGRRARGRRPARRRARARRRHHRRGEFATIEGDDVLLRQAFSNLLRNAIEACAARDIVAAVGHRVRTPDRAQRSVCTHRRSSTTARVSRADARSRVPSVLHDEGAGHRPRSGAGPEDRRHAQRACVSRQRSGPGGRITIVFPLTERPSAQFLPSCPPATRAIPASSESPIRQPREIIQFQANTHVAVWSARCTSWRT